MKVAAIDIETLDTEVSAVIVSIGICVYDPVTGETFRGATLYPDIAEQLIGGRTTSPKTLAWWREQSPEAKQAISRAKSTEKGEDIARRIHDTLEFHDVQEVWTNGPDFDTAIVNNYAKQFTGKPVIKFWTSRCYRTLKSLFGFFLTPEYLRSNGLAHDALADADFQARGHVLIQAGLTKASVTEASALQKAIDSL